MILTYDMGFDALRRASTSYLEYQQIVEGKRRDREEQSFLTRQICFYALKSHPGAKRHLKPTDLWKIGDEATIYDAVTKESQKADEDLREYGRKNGIKIV